MLDESKSSFTYTYSSAEQAEIKRIRARYTAKEESEIDKMALLRRLDAGVAKKGTVVSLILGILGALILGCGMSLVMTDIGASIGLVGVLPMLIGIPLGLIGILMICLAYPVYNLLVSRERARIAPEILRLTDELMK